MKDLKSQLSAAFGPPKEPSPPNSLAATTSPQTSVATESPDDPLSQGILAEGAHLESPWIERLKVLSRSLSSAPALGTNRKLAHAQQVTAQVMRELKKVQRQGAARDLGKLRDDFLSQREKAAWSAVKLRFAERGLSEKAYRSLKQEGADPVLVLQRLGEVDPAELAGMGAARLKALFSA